MKTPLCKRPGTRGVSCVEFAFSTIVLLPMVLGVSAIGINMIRTLETVQLARDAGRMYANGVNFALPGNKTILVTIGSPLGLSATSTTGSAGVLLSAMVYVDAAACIAVGAVDASNIPTSACTNYQKWVFKQRIVIGNSGVLTSNVGKPLTSGPTGVTVDATTGEISQSDYVLKAGAVATFTGVNPYTTMTGLPSGQVLYIAEAGAAGFNMPPFVTNAVAYSWGYF